MLIEKRLISFNYSKRRGMVKPIYIVVHDTGNVNAGADAMAHYRYFNGGNRKASAHYFVDDKRIVETVETTNASWHCGDGYGKYGITNSNSIGVEICVNSDGNYEKALENARIVIRFLIAFYNIPVARSGKAF
ncbi:N-acetylmuramoyl-L-alanine amidase family protein [Peptoniphilus porci]|uniref:peptidoglycan recognition protein family protein n=1 Tax=Peptoniphilus porci TaxID=2652280 RepID=UPI000AA4299A|nr:N-acetylmuramoyl-L-alanine amidase [Peptoniphilus porci]